jgi:hypothetical protein
MKIEPDKKKHFWVGMGMGAILYLFVSWIFPHNYGLGIGITFLLIVAVCYGFELFSLITKIGFYEIADAVAGIIGGAIGMGIVLLLEYIL